MIWIAELRKKYIMDQKATEAAGYDKGLEAGIEQGIKQGIQQGIQQNKIEIAKKLLELGDEIEKIIVATGLTKEQILSIKND